MEAYLDNSATTQPRPEAIAAVTEAMQDHYGNPSSLHDKGVEAERRLTRARGQVAQLIRAPAESIVFTSGGTEANNLALLGTARTLQSRGRHIITTQIEHPSVLAVADRLAAEGFQITRLPVDRAGRIAPAAVAAALRPDTILVSVMHVNNEVGSVQPVAEIGRLVQKQGIRLHVDAVQSAGRLPVDVGALGCDLLTISAHKLHGPKGVGALFVRRGVRLDPLLLGGGQEGGLRSGTENVPGIVGFGVAAALARQELAAGMRHMTGLRQRLLLQLEAGLGGVMINGPEPKDAAPHVLNISFAGLNKGEVLVHALADQGVYVSTGSACHSRTQKASHVLVALGLPPEQIAGAIRLSLSPLSTAAEVETCVRALAAVVPELRALRA